MLSSANVAMSWSLSRAVLTTTKKMTMGSQFQSKWFIIALIRVFFREAAVHMSKFRVRCHKCSLVFCADCKEEPYHLGKTCAQHKEFKNARKCRFCQETIKGASASNKPAFRDVCKKKDCIDLMN